MTDAKSQTEPAELPLAPKDMAPALAEAPPETLCEAPLAPVSAAAPQTDETKVDEASGTPDAADQQPEAKPEPKPPPFRVEFQLPVAMYPNVTPKILLRGCQSEAILSWRESKLKRKIISLPTGCGKTVTALAIASETTVGRVLWLAHRNELIEQPMKEVLESFPDLEAGIVKAGANDNLARLVIGSVQTVSKRRRLKNIAEGSPFSLVVIDEAHHSTSKIYKGILEALGCFDEGGPDVLGLTATIERADKVSLNEVFEDVVYSISIAEAIDAGYLVPPRPLKVPLAIDPKALRVVDAEGGKDFNQADLEKELARVNAARATALAIKEHASDKKTIVFTVSVDQAKRTAVELQALGMKAAWASGAPHMTDAQRKEVISKLAKRELNVVCNAQLLCLDEETEVLTTSGWKGIDDIQPEHEVAAWRDGMVAFETPRMIVKRDRQPGEGMVYLDTPKRSMRVTEDHGLMYRTTKGHGAFLKKPARDLVGKGCEIPLAGVATPLSIAPEQPCQPTPSALRRMISANAYNMRKREGYEWDDSFAEAERRVARKLALRYKTPRELSELECELIGFWYGDGRTEELASGGKEHFLLQSTTNPGIVSWIDATLDALGIDYVKHDIAQEGIAPAFKWSMPRGTGSGSQERRGVFHLEPYLERSGTQLLWGLDRSQFTALLKGFWKADGTCHGPNPTNLPKSFGIINKNKNLLDLLQGIASCRGYRADVRTASKPVKENHAQLYILSCSRRTDHTFSNYGKNGISALRLEEGWKPERVWCVTTSTGAIITRRRGSVAVLGNCEGFDDKEIDCVVIARPTRSKAVYIQEVGRGLRLAPHKRECLVIDIVGASDMGLVTIDAYLQETKKKTPRKRREPREGPPDPEMEWKRIRSYLKSARVDLVPHGEATFARASDGLLVTVTADGEMLLVRRKDGDDNLWVIERKGVEFTPPADIHATMDAACMLSREYGGTVAPGSEKWNAATEKQERQA